MQEDLYLGLMIIKVLCLIVIAMSVQKMAYASSEYLVGDMGLAGSGPISSVADPRYSGVYQQSMFDGTEPPVFWNLGNVQETNDYLQAAALQPESDVAVYDADMATQAANAAAAAAASPAAVAAANSAAGTSSFRGRSFYAGSQGLHPNALVAAARGL